MKRRAVLAAAGSLLVAPLGFGQPAEVRRIAILEYGDMVARASSWAAFDGRLRELGYAEGRNLLVERRAAQGVDAQLPALGRELLAATPEVILVNTTPATQVLMRLTGTVPIIFTGAADPVGTGLVASLARPGGNVTGFSAQLVDINEKRLELLREILPRAKRFALLGPGGNRGVQAVLKRLQALSRSLGVEMRLLDAGDPGAIERVFERLLSEPVDALLVASVLAAYNRQIVDLSTKSRIPASYIQKGMLEAGALVVFGPDTDAHYRRAADYAHRILTGTKPADLPIEQPKDFWLGVNLQTARALGLKIPQSILVRADRVIE
jgi:putative ABC transport system substrate-binding protein